MEDEWMFDAVSAFLASPLQLPVLTFIEENCVVFDNEEENKLVYTDIHKV